MPKFKKKPVVIEAVQWFPGMVVEGLHTEGTPRMPYDIYTCVAHGINAKNPICAAIETLEGWHLAVPGDWIITGIKGEKYPCKPDIFEATYEPVEISAPIEDNR